MLKFKSILSYNNNNYNDEDSSSSELVYSSVYSSSSNKNNVNNLKPVSMPLINSNNPNQEQYLIKKLSLNDLNNNIPTPDSKSSLLYSNGADDTQQKTPKITNINNLVLHKNSLFIGAQNWLLKLNANTFEIEQSIQYGPVLDSPFCRYNARGGEECLSNNKKQLTNNFNKVLLIHEKENLLLSCWTARQGVCDLRDLSNLTNLVQESSSASGLVANDPHNSTVGFIATSSNSQDLFYVANTYTSLGPYRDECPALAGRSLSHQASKFMDIIQSKGQGLKSSQASIEFIQRYRKSFIVKYVQGFNLGIFNYFLTVQHLDTDSSSHFTSSSSYSASNILQTKLARFCLNDLSFVKSYTELPLKCLSSKKMPNNGRKSSVLYNELISSKLVKIKGQYYIAGLFQQTTRTNFNSSLEKEEAKRQGVCLFSLKSIQAKIRENINKCHNNLNEVMRGLYFIKPDQQCRTSRMPQQQQKEAGTLGGDDDFCSLADNGLYPIGGQIPVISSSILEFESTPKKPIQFDTIQILNHQQNENEEEFDVLLMSNKHNDLQFFNIKSLNSLPILYRRIQLDNNENSNQDLIIKSPQNNIQVQETTENGQILFLVSKNLLYKFRTSACESYKTCQECMLASNSADPQCGWCPSTNQCTTKSQCFINENEKKWLNSNTNGGVDLASICVDINRIEPSTRFSLNKLESNNPTTQSIEIQFGLNLVNESSQDSYYQCVFQLNDKILIKTDARLLNLQRLKCDLPSIDKIQEIFLLNKYRDQNLVLSDDGLFKVKNYLNSNFYYYEENADNIRFRFYIENKDVKYGTVVSSSGSSSSPQTRHNITIIDCSAHKSCISCISTSNSYCKWSNNECIDYDDTIVTNFDNHIDACESFDTGTSRLLIPYTANRLQAPLQIKLNNFLDSNTNKIDPKFECIFTLFNGKFTNKNITVPYVYVNQTHGACQLSNIFNLLHEFIHNGENNEELGQVQTNLRILNLDKNTFIDSVTQGKLALLFYKCEVKALSSTSDSSNKNGCNECLNLNSQLSCMWCSNSLSNNNNNNNGSSCKFMNAKSKLAQLSQCVSSVFSTKSILNQCDRPQITNIEPQKLPLSGGTMIQISGVHMGTHLNDLIDISLKCINSSEDIPCDLNEKEYQPGGKMILCRSRASQRPRQNCKVNIRIRVHNNNNNNDDSSSTLILTNSQILVDYVDPVISSIEPSQIIQSAKFVWLTIHGENLDAGRTRSIEIIDSQSTNKESTTKPPRVVKCDIKNATSKELKCRLSDSFRLTGKKSIRIVYDAQMVVMDDDSLLRVTSNPLIKSIDKKLTFYSGGTKFNLNGFNFNSVQKAHTFITYQNIWYSDPLPALNRINNEVFEFEFPSLNKKFFNVIKEQQLVFNYKTDLADGSLLNDKYEFQIGFLMDGFNTTLDQQHHRIVYYPDLTKTQIAVRGFELIKSSMKLLIELEADETTLQFLLNDNNNLLKENLQIYFGCSYKCTQVEIFSDNKNILCQLPLNENSKCDQKPLTKIIYDLNQNSILNLVNIFMGNTEIAVEENLDLNLNFKSYIYDSLNHTELCLNLLNQQQPTVQNLNLIENLLQKSNLTSHIDVIAQHNQLQSTIKNTLLLISIIIVFLIVIILVSLVIIKTIFKMNYDSKLGRKSRNFNSFYLKDGKNFQNFDQVKEQVMQLEQNIRPICTKLYQQLHVDYLNDLNNDLIYKIYNLSYTNALPVWNFKTYLYNFFFHSQKNITRSSNNHASGTKYDTAGYNFMSSSSMSNSTTNTLLSSTLTPKITLNNTSLNLNQAQSVYATIKSSAGDAKYGTLENGSVGSKQQELLLHGSIGESMLLFDQLLNNKNFVLTFLQSVDKSPEISLIEKRNFIGLLTLALRHNLSYLYSIIKLLLSEHIANSFRTKTEKSLFKSNDYLVEQLLTNWLTIFMYNFQRDTQCSLELYRLVNCIKYYLSMAPIDQIKQQACNSLNQSTLLNYNEQYQTLYVNLIVNNNNKNFYTIPFIDCDTIAQAKEKCIEFIFKSNLNLSQFNLVYKPKVNDVDIELCLILIKNEAAQGESGEQKMGTLQQQTTFIELKETEEEILAAAAAASSSNSNSTSLINPDTPKRLLTLRDYNIQNGSFINLLIKESPALTPKPAQNEDQHHVYASTISISNEYAVYSSNPVPSQPQSKSDSRKYLSNAYHLINPSAQLNSDSVNLIPNNLALPKPDDSDLSKNKKSKKAKKKYEKLLNTVKSQDSGVTTVSLIKTSDMSNSSSSGTTSVSSSGQPSPNPSSTFTTTTSSPHDTSNRSNSSSNQLARLLVNKGTIQPFIDQFIETIFSNTSNLPPVVQHLFEFIDVELRRHQQKDLTKEGASRLSDEDREKLSKEWKINCYFFKYWFNLIQNPDYLLDVNKTELIDSSLGTVVDALQDSCSQITNSNGDYKTSSSSSHVLNRLMFINDTPKYKQLIENFLNEFKVNYQPISDHELYFYLNEFSKMNIHQDLINGQQLDATMNNQLGLNINIECQSSRTITTGNTNNSSDELSSIQILLKLYEFYGKQEQQINLDLGQQQCSILLPVHHRLVQIKELMNLNTANISQQQSIILNANSAATLNRAYLQNGNASASQLIAQQQQQQTNIYQQPMNVQFNQQTMNSHVFSKNNNNNLNNNFF